MAAAQGSGSRRVEVAADRLAGWLDRFAARHGAVTWTPGAAEVVVSAVDGALARIEVPFPPLSSADGRLGDGTLGDGPLRDALVAHAQRSRRVGVLLVRLGGHGAGVFEGERLVDSKVGSRQVHGRTSAGGWSQQRFARRREGQVRVALEAAADVAVRVLVPVVATLDAVVLGGDRRSLDTVLADRRLAILRPLVVPPLHDVPDPRQVVLAAMPARIRAVRITVTDPPGDLG